MKPNDISRVDHKLKTMRLKENLLKECRVMASFAITRGKSVDATHIAPLHKEDGDIKGSELLPVYNYLVNLVKPATPGTLVLFEKNRQSTNRFKFLGPLPIVRQFMLLSMFSLLALILTSLSSDVNTHTIQLSLLQGNGIDQALRLTFLLACASVGASFYALFKMNSYINQGTFDMKYSATYWSRFVLGLVAGVLLSELFVVFINPTESTEKITSNEGLNENVVLDSANYLLKPILAILGGFSANLVYRILNRLIEAVESIFKGSSSEAVQQMQQKMTMEGQENEHRIKSVAAQQILALKSDLVAKGAGAEALDKIDNTIGVLMNSVPANKASVNLTPEEVSDLLQDKGAPLTAPVPDQVETNTENSAQPAGEDPNEGTVGKPTSNW